MKKNVFLIVAVLGILGVSKVAKADTIVNCASNDFRLARCFLSEPADYVTLYYRISDSACIEGRTWGYDRYSIWVDQGCRAQFRVVSYGNDPRWPNPPRYPRDPRDPWNPRDPRNPWYPLTDTIECSSGDYRFKRCYTSQYIYRADLEARISNSACVRGVSWGFDRNGIWVDRGCRGIFRVYY